MAVVLVLDDEPAVLDFVRQCIERHGHTPVLATSPQEGIRLATDRRAELAILDLDLRHPQINGLAVWSVLKKQLPGLAGLLLTGRATRQHAFEGGRLGIGGLIEKPFRAEDLALAMDAVMGAVSPGRHAVEERDGDAVFDGMVGKSPAMRMVFKFIRAAASSEYPVLILGETGTGKELVARSIHKRSPRNGGPFVAVNCPAVPATLFESEFFGHERGAFTGATASRSGHFEQARGGTIFLDEIGDLSLEAQAKLLRVIDFREAVRLGSSQPRRLDARVVAATNVDLQEAVRRHAFRGDLYWRLRAMTIELPPIRDRGTDLELLIDAMLARLAREGGFATAGLSREARQTLLAHPWPGNVREIEVTLRAALHLGGIEPIEASHLAISPTGRPPGAPATQMDASLPEGMALSAWLSNETARVEKTLIEGALRSSNGVQSVAAAKLGLDPRTLYTKMHRYSISGATSWRSDQ